MHKQFIIIILLHFALLSNAQYSYNVLIQTPANEEAEFVYHDKLNDEQIVIVIVECFSSDTNCVAECTIYTLTNSGDTLRWPFVNRRNDTLFSINNIIQEDNGDYFMTGIGWTLDSIGRPKNAFDYNIKWNSNHEIIWESVHQRPAQFQGYSKSHNFKILKRIDNSYLVARTIWSGSPLQPYNYLVEVNPTNGAVVKERTPPIIGLLQSLTYTIDSSEIMMHMGSTYMRECNRNDVGVIMLDTATYDTIRGHCYNRDDDDPEKYWCVDTPYDAMIRKDGHLILAGTADCHNKIEGDLSEEYLFIYQYDTSFQLVNSTFLTDKDTINYGGWYETMDINDNNEICLAGVFNLGFGPWNPQYDWIYLAKVDENLVLMSERYMGGDATYEMFSMAATPDGGMVVSGTRYDYLVNDFEHDAFVIKTDGGLWVGQNETTTIPVHSALVYPNPGNDLIHIRTTEYPSVFELYDVQGKLILSTQIENHITSINIYSLTTGFYTWTLTEDKRIIDNGKWIKITP
ncbi:MAG: T9SS type A sorting domain-containing protein [Bacteroidales bacterium]|nr:T9SS type A sorting domain-containing protein [Bacteroidales bacterium]